MTYKFQGVSHSSAGYLLYAMVTMKHAFDYNQVKIIYISIQQSKNLLNLVQPAVKYC